MGKRERFEEEDVKFAKRRKTLYKKAQELSILCGSEIAVVIISRATGKVSTYGSPDPGIVIGRYQSQKKNVQDGARSGSGKVIMTKDEENTMKHLLVPSEEENLGTIPNPEPMTTTEPFLWPGLMEIASSSSSLSWMPSSSSIQCSQPLATSYGCGGGLDGLSYFDFDASSSGLMDPKSLNQEESGATYGSAPMIYSSSSFSSSGSGFEFLSSSSDYRCGFNGLSALDWQGSGLDPNFLNQERGAKYDESSIPISYSSSSSSVSSVLPPSSSIDCLQPMATPQTGYGFDDPLFLDVTEPEPSFDVGEFLDELNRSHPISPSSNGHGFNDDDPLLFDVNDDDPLFFGMIDDDPLFFDVNEFF